MMVAPKRIRILTWDGKLVSASKAKRRLQHLTGLFYVASVGIQTLSNLQYRLAYKRVAYKPRLGSTSLYSLIRHTAAVSQLQSETIQDKSSGLATTMPRRLALQIIVRKIDRAGFNIPMHRFIYKLVAVYLLDRATWHTIDVDVVDDYVGQFHRQVIARVIAPMLQRAASTTATYA